MKEQIITDKKIIKELKKNGVLHIDAICINCIHDVLQLVLDEFKPNIQNDTSKDGALLASFGITEVENGIYRLSIMVR